MVSGPSARYSPPAVTLSGPAPPARPMCRQGVRLAPAICPVIRFRPSTQDAVARCPVSRLSSAALLAETGTTRRATSDPGRTKNRMQAGIR